MTLPHAFKPGQSGNPKGKESKAAKLERVGALVAWRQS
jgi:Family of unknown function (DUF5681)